MSPLKPIRTLSLSLLIALSLSGVNVRGQDAESKEVPVALITAGGSRLLGMLDVSHPLLFRNDTGATRPLNLVKSTRIVFGERIDPNLENDARLAIGDLQSDQFAVREKALASLRSLGRAALGPLRRATASADAEEASRARALLTEMNLQNAADTGDRVTQADGSGLSGSLSNTELTVRTRWAKITVPLQALEALEFLKVAELNVPSLLPATQASVAINQTTAPPVGKAAERWMPLTDAEKLGANAQAAPQTIAEALLGLRMLTMQRVPDVKSEKRGATKELKTGERLEQAYTSWGVVLKASEPNATVEVSDVPLLGVSQGLSAVVRDSDLEVNFLLPGTFEPKTGDFRAAGVSSVGAVIKADSVGTIGLAVYDRSGRLLAQVLNQNDSNLMAGGMRQDEFLGVRSKVPIVRARFFRVGDANTKPRSIILDDLVFDHVVSVDRATERACIWLTSGERIAGKMLPAPASKGDAKPEETLWIAPEFLSAKNPPLQIAATEIERYEPPLEFENSDKPRKFMGTPHSVLLQNGECFRARLMKMDEKGVVFLLPGGVELALPRSFIRKVELQPAKVEPGELPPPTTVKDEEAPNVDLKTREEATGDPDKKDSAAEKDKEKEKEKEKEKDKDKEQDKKKENTPAPAISHMDNAEVVEVDPEQSLVTIRDEDGDLPIGLPMIKSFVLPKDPNAAKANPKFRDWILTLREGSRFEIVLLAITPDGVTAEMAGGTVVLPSHVIESVQRQRRK